MRVRGFHRRWLEMTVAVSVACGALVVTAAVATAATTTTTTTSASLTTTTVPQHVVNQPNLDALTPHVQALSGPGVQYQSSSGPSSQGSGAGAPTFLHSPGGPYLYDTNGRIVLLHGTNVVYKHAPYIAYPDPGKPWDFSAADAARMQSLGFNVVRLGIEWQALEPGSGGPNQSKICSPGPPGNPHEFDRAVADRYLRHVAATVQLLGRYGIYTLLDMHQDVYNSNFRGEGAPDWAVCTDNVPIVPSGGRWSNNYANPQLQTAVAALLVQRRGRRPPGQSRPRLVDGGELLQERPLGRRLRPLQRAVLDRDAGRVRIDLHRPAGVLLHREGPHRLPGQRCHSARVPVRRAGQRRDPGDPGRRSQPPDLRGAGHLLGAPEGTSRPSWARCPSSALVFNFHVYCGDRSPRDRQPDQLAACLQSEETSAAEQDITRLSMSSASQSSGPAIFMSEFGATTSTALVGFDTEWAGLDQVGWAYWAWKYYDDPTGSSAEGLVRPDGNYSPIVTVLSRTYPQAVAGTPNSVLFNPFTGAFNMVYAPTLAARGDDGSSSRQQQHYPNGWCAAVKGGRITSAPGATRLTVQTVGPSRAGLHLGDGGWVPVWLRPSRPDLGSDPPLLRRHERVGVGRDRGELRVGRGK